MKNIVLALALCAVIAIGAMSKIGKAIKAPSTRSTSSHRR